MVALAKASAHLFISMLEINEPVPDPESIVPGEVISLAKIKDSIKSRFFKRRITPQYHYFKGVLAHSRMIGG